MSSKLLRKQLAALHTNEADSGKGNLSAGKGISKPAHKEKGRKVGSRSSSKVTQTKEEIVARNLAWHKQTKKTQEATLELMNKV
ncbi:hypothetical protein MNEG_5796 [Monoraphidium neglectum]|jgi:hypothetical protein|uniref:Uncharacterized protein n=1 Tax=Monoraphidium neglectum TaxID=145388 RepID=A0A0D2MGG1_9CHLO|nr:hypothetical protein MNEG_5796 [Monoraphidium neglectum]KIZ02160.1 hypothetical protein MNEG_5796 [Monoraphidium neglectum]|eukprot:XP_013901179.1 hypothetical protein MNEG_5796 [Monoraphidium neglectum]